VSPEQAFSLILREQREKQHLSQQQLALDANLDRTYISLLERGLRKPTITTIFQLSETLGIPPELFIKLVREKASEIGTDNSSDR
jgi:transcriptional regulator with XRE-family HTH domain